mmetsp:Transcript_132696/g.230102  ORF Transcript_132696/g.230102 Transcript_132696/m.230102 type:complete len:96 (-) Transcript_132696:132-419(-)
MWGVVPIMVGVVPSTQMSHKPWSRRDRKTATPPNDTHLWWMLGHPTSPLTIWLAWILRSPMAINYPVGHSYYPVEYPYYPVCHPYYPVEYPYYPV